MFVRIEPGPLFHSGHFDPASIQARPIFQSSFYKSKRYFIYKSYHSSWYKWLPLTSVCVSFPWPQLLLACENPFSFKASKLSCLCYFLLLASRYPEMLCVYIQTQRVFEPDLYMDTNGSVVVFCWNALLAPSARNNSSVRLQRMPPCQIACEWSGSPPRFKLQCSHRRELHTEVHLAISGSVWWWLYHRTRHPT